MEGLYDDSLISENGSQGARLPRATLEEKIETLDWFYNHGTKSQQYTVRYFNEQGRFSVTKSSFNRWLKNEEELRRNYQTLSSVNRSQYKTNPNYKHALVDKCLEYWYEQMILSNQNVSERELIQQYQVFLNLNGGGEEKEKSNGWCYHFKKKNEKRKTVLLRFTNMIIGLQSQGLQEERYKIKTLLQDAPPSDIYQFDEIFISGSIGKFNKTLTPDNKRFCCGFITNSDGTDWPTPLIVGKAPYIISEREKMYHGNYSGCITYDLFVDWITRWNSSLDRKIYLLLDCQYEHFVDTTEFDKIEFIWLNPFLQTNLNYVGTFAQVAVRNGGLVEYQPLYLGILQTLKMLVRVSCLQHYSTVMKYEATPNFEILTSQQVFQIIVDSWMKMRKDYKTCVATGFENSGLLNDIVDESQYGKQFMDKELLSKYVSLSFQYDSGVDPAMKQTPQGINQVLFPFEDQFSNKFYSDVEILALMKIRAKDLESASVPLLQLPSTTTQLDLQEEEKMKRLINVEMRSFFNKYATGAAGDKYRQSCVLFDKFLNEFLQESV